MFRKRRLIELVDDLHRAEEFPLRIELKNSKFRTIATRSGRVVTNEFVGEMDDVLSNNVMELALGTNAGANADTLVWRFNSPINESALGFHVAVGDGDRSPHVDFMCASEASYDAFFQNGRY